MDSTDGCQPQEGNSLGSCGGLKLLELVLLDKLANTQIKGKLLPDDGS
jgi:hypothetical protein